MSAIKIGNTGVPLPRISRIRAFPDFRVSVIWAEGSRTGAADTVDLAPVINTHKFYRPLRKNKKLFRTAHLVDDGHAIAWGDGTIDMSAELIEDIADQAMSPKDFAPRVVALAWYAHEARQKASNPASSLSAQGEGGRTGWLSEVLSRASQDEPAPGGGRTGWHSELLSRASQDEPAPGGGRAGWHPELLSRASQEPAPGGRRAGWHSELLSRASPDDPAPGGGRAGGLPELLSRASQDEPAPGGGRAGWQSERLSRASQDEHAPGGGRAGWHSERLSRASQDEPAPGGGRAGGLSELLSRASQDEPGPGGGAPAHDPDAGTPHTVESLDAAAVDIARMVAYDAAGDLWSERNVFTRMLYTMQSQKAFEEVRRKYRRDRDFMRTVDCYIGEFERLLGDVSCDYHGQVLARTYLTSEMGKVYTMLAHAAGRFDRSGLRSDEYTV
jgi:hypothetical protein